MYQVINGTSYHAETSLPVINELEIARLNHRRIRLYLGDVKSGRSWNEDHDVYGRVSRSTGPSKVPILIHNTRSRGGGHILDQCIVRIIDLKTHRLLYSHPSFHAGIFEIRSGDIEHLPVEVFIDGEVHAHFETEKEANTFITIMKGY